MPLLIGESPAGVAVLGRDDGRPPSTEADVAVIEELSRRLAAGWATVEAFAREHTVAETLQRALLPDALPRIPGLDLAVRYLPATDGVHVGGDWYDVFPLDRDRVALAIGDVAGHSIGSASIMGQIRSLLRGYALDYGLRPTSCGAPTPPCASSCRIPSPPSSTPCSTCPPASLPTPTPVIRPLFTPAAGATAGTSTAPRGRCSGPAPTPSTSPAAGASPRGEAPPLHRRADRRPPARHHRGLQRARPGVGPVSRPDSGTDLPVRQVRDARLRHPRRRRVHSRHPPARPAFPLTTGAPTLTCSAGDLPTGLNCRLSVNRP